jgi:putative NADPH-quinone reductase
MKVLTKGLTDAGHSNEVIDLYAIDFDPVLRAQDAPNWMDENIPQSARHQDDDLQRRGVSVKLRRRDDG